MVRCVTASSVIVCDRVEASSLSTSHVIETLNVQAISLE